jgi:DNA (cytosine-5)-methyltransferase 1
MSKLKAISLFSGAGGMDVGVLSAGFDIIAANEIDSYACQTYKANHPNSRLIEGDINLHINEIIQFKKIDLIVGGPPCQGFSIAGKMNPEDPRSSLIFSFCDVVEKISPISFIMENVKALGTLSKFENIRSKLLTRLDKAGYSVTTVLLNAKDYGIPQSRERVFFIGIKKGYARINEFDFQKYKQPAVSLRDAISHLNRAGTITNPNITKAKITLAAKPILRKSPYAGMLFNGQGRPLNPDTWCSTLPASMGGNRTPIIDEDHMYDFKTSWVEKYHQDILKGNLSADYKEAPSRLRRLTIDEAAIIQTFPNNYKFIGPQTKIFSQIGNAVPCKLAQVVASVVKENLEKIKARDTKKLDEKILS